MIHMFSQGAGCRIGSVQCEHVTEMLASYLDWKLAMLNSELFGSVQHVN